MPARRDVGQHAGVGGDAVAGDEERGVHVPLGELREQRLGVRAGAVVEGDGGQLGAGGGRARGQRERQGQTGGQKAAQQGFPGISHGSEALRCEKAPSGYRRRA